LPWEGEGWMYAFSEEATRGLRLTVGKMEGELLLLVMIVSGRGPLSSQANDNWTIGLLLGANVKQQMANRRERRSVRYWWVQRQSVDKDWEDGMAYPTHAREAYSSRARER
jgi:hypothetical protein